MKKATEMTDEELLAAIQSKASKSNKFEDDQKAKGNNYKYRLVAITGSNERIVQDVYYPQEMSRDSFKSMKRSIKREFQCDKVVHLLVCIL